MLLSIGSPSFPRQLAELWPDAEYAAFQQCLAANPEKGDVIPGLGGLRKVRWAAKGKGKRGGARRSTFGCPRLIRPRRSRCPPRLALSRDEAELRC